MFEDDPSAQPVDLVRIFTDVDFLIGFVLPIALLSAAFAMLKNSDGRLTRSNYVDCCIGLFAGTVGAFFLTGIAQYLFLKGILGIELPVTNQMLWSIWVSVGALIWVVGETSFARLTYRVRQESLVIPRDREGGNPSMSTNQIFKKQLAKQLGFLDRSAIAFDEGHTDEAFRIATTLRVIFHNTRKSTSLLTHLKSPNVSVRSTVPDMSKMEAAIAGRQVDEFFMSLATIRVSASSAIVPKTEVSSHDRMIPADEWWNERFASINGVNYTRRSLVLWAANKDGGAHVDDVLPPDYEGIKASGAFGTFICGGREIPLEAAHLVFLRSMAFEVLNSQQLRALAQ